MTDIRTFAELADLRERLERAPDVSARVASRAADSFSEFARAALDAHESLSGRPFGPGVTLNRSGKLRAEAIRYTASGSSVRASVGAVPYARYQLKNGILPLPKQIPERWRAELGAIADEELRKALTP